LLSLVIIRGLESRDWRVRRGRNRKQKVKFAIFSDFTFCFVESPARDGQALWEAAFPPIESREEE